jgi:hypothetical protein
MSFDNGSAGIYNVDYPDVVQPSVAGTGTVVLRYSTGAGAAVLHGNGRVLGLGFPMETIVDAGLRTQLMERVLQLMCPLPVRPIGPVVQGTTLQVALSFPGEGNRPYFAAASLANAPGIPVPGGKTVPLAMDDLFWFSLSSQPIFVDMIGTLDGSGAGGSLFPDWTGDGFIGALVSKALIRVEFDGSNAREAERYDMGKRIREIEQGPDGAIWLLEDGDGGRLLKLTPK